MTYPIRRYMQKKGPDFKEFATEPEAQRAFKEIKEALRNEFYQAWPDYGATRAPR